MIKKVKAGEHTQKYVEFSKRAASGEYPSKRISKVGSMVGGMIGIVLSIVGIIGSIGGYIWGIGIFFAGVVTVISNLLNIKRIK
ncbi:hypothetical protein AB3Z07_12255 [Metabacillus halosaccharovorans]|uniref:hypothetical protein n=1 Tax=Metabacillus halosaccharovorans TaxID=930124 RepID=UPI0034CE2AD6